MYASHLPGKLVRFQLSRRNWEAYYCLCDVWYRRPRLGFWSWGKGRKTSNAGFEGIPSWCPQYPGGEHCAEVECLVFRSWGRFLNLVVEARSYPAFACDAIRGSVDRCSETLHLYCTFSTGYIILELQQNFSNNPSPCTYYRIFISPVRNLDMWNAQMRNIKR